MAQQIDVNLPVRNPEGSKAFVASLGFGFNPQFTTDDAPCMVVGENIFIMLLVEKFFKTSTQKEICDAMRSTEVVVCVSCDSRAAVDALVAKAKAAGGTTPREPQDHGFMDGHAVEGLDGHIWELISMAPSTQG